MQTSLSKRSITASLTAFGLASKSTGARANLMFFTERICTTLRLIQGCCTPIGAECLLSQQLLMGALPANTVRTTTVSVVIVNTKNITLHNWVYISARIFWTSFKSAEAQLVELLRISDRKVGGSNSGSTCPKYRIFFPMKLTASCMATATHWCMSFCVFKDAAEFHRHEKIWKLKAFTWYGCAARSSTSLQQALFTWMDRRNCVCW